MPSQVIEKPYTVLGHLNRGLQWDEILKQNQNDACSQYADGYSIHGDRKAIWGKYLLSNKGKSFPI